MFVNRLWFSEKSEVPKSLPQLANLHLSILFNLCTNPKTSPEPKKTPKHVLTQRAVCAESKGGLVSRWLNGGTWVQSLN
jgi:hypothetical protein